MGFAVCLPDWKESDYLLVFFTGLEEKNQRHRDID